MGAVVKSNLDKIGNDCILGYSMTEQSGLYNYIKEFKKKKNVFIYIDTAVEAPSFDEVELIMSCIQSKTVYDMKDNELRKIVAQFFPDVCMQSQSSLVIALRDLVGRLKRANVNNTIAKNAFVKVLKAFDSTFLEVYKAFENGGSNVLYYGTVNKYDLMTFDVLLGLGIGVIVVSKDEKVSKLIESDISMHDGQEHDFSFLEPLLFDEDVETWNVWNTWFKLQDKETLDNCLDTIFKKTIRVKNKEHKLAYVGFKGVLNEESYELALYNFYLSAKDHCLLIHEKLENPSYDEMENYRVHYSDVKTTIESLMNQYFFLNSSPYPKRVAVAFRKMMKGRDKKDNLWVVYTIQLLRVCDALFKELTDFSVVPVLILFGNIHVKLQELIPVLKELPIDIVHFAPNMSWEIKDKGIQYFMTGNNNTSITSFPVNYKIKQVATVAYSAEQELNTILYDGNLIARFKQFKGINPVVLKTTYDEVDILWNEPAKFRPSFLVSGDVVTIPTIFMKINGVGGNVKEYINSVVRKKGDNTFLVTDFPYITRENGCEDLCDDSSNSILDLCDKRVRNTCSMMEYDDCYQFMKQMVYKNKVDFDRIKKSPYWSYGVYSRETQDLICERIQNLITLEWVRKMPVKTVYTILTVLLHMNPRLVQMIHKYDFTDAIPKIVYFNTGRETCSLEDCILLMFLSTLGFDILVYAPTGYAVIEQYIGQEYFTKIELGEYKFDINADTILTRKAEPKKKGFLSSIFGQ